MNKLVKFFSKIASIPSRSELEAMEKELKQKEESLRQQEQQMKRERRICEVNDYLDSLTIEELRRITFNGVRPGYEACIADEIFNQKRVDQEIEKRRNQQEIPPGNRASFRLAEERRERNFQRNQQDYVDDLFAKASTTDLKRIARDYYRPGSSDSVSVYVDLGVIDKIEEAIEAELKQKLENRADQGLGFRCIEDKRQSWLKEGQESYLDALIRTQTDGDLRFLISNYYDPDDDGIDMGLNYDLIKGIKKAIAEEKVVKDNSVRRLTYFADEKERHCRSTGFSSSKDSYNQEFKLSA